MKKKPIYILFLVSFVLFVIGVCYIQNRKQQEAEHQRKLEARFDDIAYRVEPYLNEHFTRLRYVMGIEIQLMKQAYNYDRFNYLANYEYLYEQSRIGYQLRWDPQRDVIFMGYLYGVLTNNVPKSRKEEGKAFFDLATIGSEFWETFDLKNDYDAWMEKSLHVIDVIDNSLRILRKYDKGLPFDEGTRLLGPSDFNLEKY